MNNNGNFDFDTDAEGTDTMSTENIIDTDTDDTDAAPDLSGLFDDIAQTADGDHTGDIDADGVDADETVADIERIPEEEEVRVAPDSGNRRRRTRVVAPSADERPDPVAKPVPLAEAEAADPERGPASDLASRQVAASAHLPKPGRSGAASAITLARKSTETVRRNVLTSLANMTVDQLASVYSAGRGMETVSWVARAGAAFYAMARTEEEYKADKKRFKAAGDNMKSLQDKLAAKFTSSAGQPIKAMTLYHDSRIYEAFFLNRDIDSDDADKATLDVKNALEVLGQRSYFEIALLAPDPIVALGIMVEKTLAATVPYTTREAREDVMALKAGATAGAVATGDAGGPKKQAQGRLISGDRFYKQYPSEVADTMAAIHEATNILNNDAKAENVRYVYRGADRRFHVFDTLPGDADTGYIAVVKAKGDIHIVIGQS